MYIVDPGLPAITEFLYCFKVPAACNGHFPDRDLFLCRYSEPVSLPEGQQHAGECCIAPVQRMLCKYLEVDNSQVGSKYNKHLAVHNVDNIFINLHVALGCMVVTQHRLYYDQLV